MTMKFTVEQRHLTDAEGRPIPAGDPKSVSFETIDGDTIDDAINVFIRKSGAELIGTVLKFPGFQAVATVRNATGVYTVQFTPSSQAFSI
ncbi:MAG TPA: hypothetical protein VJZ00_24910 [Thermoanaerobaculia bacterium]|nr:hypothetical protein [Thermoanaerobaculia bacterium]